MKMCVVCRIRPREGKSYCKICRQEMQRKYYADRKNPNPSKHVVTEYQEPLVTLEEQRHLIGLDPYLPEPLFVGKPVFVIDQELRRYFK